MKFLILLTTVLASVSTANAQSNLEVYDQSFRRDHRASTSIYALVELGIGAGLYFIPKSKLQLAFWSKLAPAEAAKLKEAIKDQKDYAKQMKALQKEGKAITEDSKKFAKDLEGEVKRLSGELEAAKDLRLQKMGFFRRTANGAISKGLTVYYVVRGAVMIYIVLDGFSRIAVVLKDTVMGDIDQPLETVSEDEMQHFLP